MSDWQLLIYGGAGFVMSIISGIAGAGAGFITTPLAIFLGLTPAQAVSSGKFNGLSTATGSLLGLRRHTGRVSRLRIGAIMVLAFGVGLLAPYIIKSLDNHFYRFALGVILLCMIPVMIYKKVGLKPHQPSRLQKIIGGVLLTISLFLQGIFSGGLGSLVNVVLMGLLGQTANEAHITKRWSQLVLNITIIVGLLGSHLIVWRVVAMGMTVNFCGSYLGGRIAIKRGDALAVNVMLGLILVAAIFLIAGAV